MRPSETRCARLLQGENRSREIRYNSLRVCGKRVVNEVDGVAVTVDGVDVAVDVVSAATAGVASP